MADDERVPTNLRTLLIVEALAKAGRPLTPSEINREIGLPKPSIHRICQTLVDEGFLARDSDPKRLRPARRLRNLAAGLFSASHIHIARHQILMHVAETMGETVNFVVPEEKGMRYLDRVEAEWPLRIQLPIGTHVPFHCTASGKTFLASMANRSRRACVGSLDLKRHTANTLTDAIALLAELEEIRQRGYALDNEEFMEGMVAIAVPITDPDGKFLAALAVHGPSLRFGLSSARAHADALLAVSNRLTAVIFD